MGLKTKIFVGHLPDGCKNEDLQELFEKHGKVVECDVINKYGFVHMNSPEEADEAIKALNFFKFNGSVLNVELSKSKLHLEPGAPGRARGGQSMRGRQMGSGGGYRNGNGHAPGPRDGFGGRNGFYDDGYRAGEGFRGRFDGPPRDPYYEGYRERPRPYPVSPYERRPLPPSMGPREDMYSRRAPPPAPYEDLYSRRPPPPTASYFGRSEYERMPPSNDYPYSRRSPPAADRTLAGPPMRRQPYY